MRQNAATTGNVATPIRKFRWSRSNDEALLELLNSKELVELNQSYANTKKEVDAIKGVHLPVIRSRPATADRQTRKFIRGNWLERAEQIAPGIPELFHLKTTIDDRLKFARWLVSKDNPLAARVWANRV